MPINPKIKQFEDSLKQLSRALREQRLNKIDQARAVQRQRKLDRAKKKVTPRTEEELNRLRQPHSLKDLKVDLKPRSIQEMMDMIATSATELVLLRIEYKNELRNIAPYEIRQSPIGTKVLLWATCSIHQYRIHSFDINKITRMALTAIRWYPEAGYEVKIRRS